MSASKNQLGANFLLTSAIFIASTLTFIHPAKAQTADLYINQFLEETNELIGDNRSQIKNISNPPECQTENYGRERDRHEITATSQEYNVKSSRQIQPRENSERQSVRANNREES